MGWANLSYIDLSQPMVDDTNKQKWPSLCCKLLSRLKMGKVNENGWACSKLKNYNTEFIYEDLEYYLNEWTRYKLNKLVKWINGVTI